MSAQKTFALVMGIVLVIIGLLGFFNNPIVGEDGFFGSNTYQNILHLIAGAIGVYVGTKGQGHGYNMILGWIGVALGVLGFIPGVSGLFADLLNINTEITVLHLVLGVLFLIVAYSAKKM